MLLLKHLLWAPLTRLRPVSARRLANAVIVIVFLAGLAVPMLGSFLGRVGILAAENRAPAPPPRWQQDFAKQFDAYYADRTGGRKSLLKHRNQFLLEYFDESPTKNVLIGTDDWLYLNTGFDPLDPRASQDYELERAATALRARAAWCRARGIVYVVQVAREKHFVHAEHLPPRLRGRVFVDPVPELKTLCPGVTILDPRSMLATAAGTEQVYYKKDSHWNTRGIVHGYRQLAETLEALVPGYHATPATAFTPASDWKAQGDLSALLGRMAPSPAAGETIEWFHRPAKPSTWLPADAIDTANATIRLSHIPSLNVRTTASNPLKLVLLHDSFGIDFRDSLAGDVANFQALGTYRFPTAWLDRERPDVIVQQFVDRAMLKSHFVIID